MCFLFPHVLLKTSSRYNRDIRVVGQWGGVKLLVNGSPQSGPYIKKLWDRALGAFRAQNLRDVTSILVLGIGGGTVIELLCARYPHAAITAVDIDPTMIDIAKRYFHIHKIPHLRTLRRGACAFVREGARRKKQWDLVIVDVFIGREAPEFVAAAPFHRLIKRILTPGGAFFLNYLREHEYRPKSERLFLLLKRTFPHVRDYATANNRFFFART